MIVTDRPKAHEANEAQVWDADAAAVFWRGLESQGDRAGAEAFVEGEFPPGVDTPPDQASRREFLALMAGSFALAGLTGCTRQPEEAIVPYVEQPEQLVPGEPLFFATAHTRGGYALGVLAESHEGRPTKIEGNPEHPASRGATSVFAQAAPLNLYDPDRSGAVTWMDRPNSWVAFEDMLGDRLERLREVDGRGLALLTDNFTSPALLEQVRALLERMPEARWYVHEPVAPLVRIGGEKGDPRWLPIYHPERAEVILTLESDFLYIEAGSVLYAREFADKRRVREDRPHMNRMYSVEPMPTVTGANADHALPLRSSRIEPFTIAVARRLGLDVEATEEVRGLEEEHDRWIEAVADDLREHRGAGLVVAGPGQPEAVHRLVHRINEELENVGETVTYVEAFDAVAAEESGTIEELAAEMEAGRVETLVMSGCNPVYTAPADLEFAERLHRVEMRIHHGLHRDETARHCQWHLPALHELEMWSDARSHEGTATIIQPLIAPLYQGRSEHELLGMLLGDSAPSAYEIVREHWGRRRGGEVEDFERWWRKTLHDGVVEGTKAEEVHVSLEEHQSGGGDEVVGGLEVIFRPDPMLWDGAYANNPWLQELPDQITKLVWDNAAMMSVGTAMDLGVDSEDMVELRRGEHRVEAPVWVVPGHAEGCVTLFLGYGREYAGRVAGHLELEDEYALRTGRRAGFDAYRLRTSDAPHTAHGLEIVPLGRAISLASTQHHQVFKEAEARHLIRTAGIEEFRKPGTAIHHAEPHESLYYPYDYEHVHKWGMVIDLTTCIGCSACTIACQAENNIPVVGKMEVQKGREMHWIRIDRYYGGPVESPEIYHQPVPCMHCEKAPCEVVCPVAATLHSEEGLNQMVYNRCIGTRYCSNNCPYKVRRFNFLEYNHEERLETRQLQKNPNVSVRSRGVMEKCTYCVQRIEAARIEAMTHNRDIGPNEVVPACQQVCPTNAIEFGDMNHPEAEVSKLKAQPHNYGMLAELNTRPRTTYLAEVHNKNPVLHEEHKKKKTKG